MSGMSARRYAVGLMSGTSLDGIDAALVEVGGAPGRPRIRLQAFVSAPYPASTRKTLLQVASGQPSSAGEISGLNYELGELFARAALAVCQRGGIEPARLSVIGSHGQTIFHQGSPGPRDTHHFNRRPASTLQIAEPAVIAEKTRATVVADFRAADLAAGGQGAPLVPMVDYLLLRDARQGSIALNLGGIANLTAIPPGARMEDVFGFDTGPANMVIDGLIRNITRGRKTFDDDGAWASRGKAIEPLLARLLRQPFFTRKPPKSAGREQFGDNFLKKFFLPQRAPREDLLRAATELTARSVAQAIQRFVIPRGGFHRLIISGGGARNHFLRRRLRELLPGLAHFTSDDFGLPVNAKEAIAFALLADRALCGLPGNLPAVTGARRAVALGKIVRPGDPLEKPAR